MSPIKGRIALFACIALAAAVAVLVAVRPIEAQTSTVKPVIVRNLDAPDRQEIYRQDLEVHLSPGEQEAHECTANIPDGKRLVLEQVSAGAMLPTGQRYISLTINGNATDSSYSKLAMLPLPYQVSAGSYDYFRITSLVKARRAAGSPVCAWVVRDLSDGGGHVSVTLSGYLVDAP